jgi:hypothetical protein
MPIDWAQFQRDVDAAVAGAAARTDDRLAGRISQVTRLTDDEVKAMFPDPVDAQKVARLMEIVKRAGDRNAKINELVQNIETFAGVTLKLLEKLA